MSATDPGLIRVSSRARRIPRRRRARGNPVSPGILRVAWRLHRRGHVLRAVGLPYVTSLLLLEKERTGASISPAFWFRRARRLLPAVLLMLVFVELCWRHRAPIQAGVAALEHPMDAVLRRELALHCQRNQGYVRRVHVGLHAPPRVVARDRGAVRSRLARLIMAAVVFSRGVAGGRSPSSTALVSSSPSPASIWLFQTASVRHTTPTSMIQILVGVPLAALAESGAAQDRCRWLARGASTMSACGRVLLLDGRNWRATSASPPDWRFARRRRSGDWKRRRPVFRPGALRTQFAGRGEILIRPDPWRWPAILAIVSAPVVSRELPGSSGVNVTRLLRERSASPPYRCMDWSNRFARIACPERVRPCRAWLLPWLIAVAAVAGAAVWATPTLPDSAGRVENCRLSCRQRHAVLPVEGIAARPGRSRSSATRSPARSDPGVRTARRRARIDRTC